MQTILKHFSFAILLIILFNACKKESDILIKQTKKFRPFEISGFVLGEPLEQYFDGEKVRELYGKIQPAEPLLAFMSDKTEMELRKKGTGEVVYRQTFRIEDEKNKVPLFFFDGKWKYKYEYPNISGTDFLANFYFDVPEDSAAADIYLTVVEFWFDWDDINDPQKILKYHEFPLAKNVKNGWSSFIKLSKLPDLPKQRPESEFWPVPSIKKAGTDEYYVVKDINHSAFNMQLPQGGESQGTVQSIHLSVTNEGYIRYEDLVQIFPK
jgi:hypothetical protein